MPSGQENIKLNKENYPQLVLVIKDKDDNQRECLKIMKNLTHENVLGVYFWEEVENEPYILVHVEPYTESVSKIVANAKFLVERMTELVPSPAFQETVVLWSNASWKIISLWEPLLSGHLKRKSLQTMKLQLKDHEFFWDSNMKKIFFAYDVPQIFKNDAVKQKFQESSSMPSLPWTTSWKPGVIPDELMKHMLIYRGEHGLAPYDAYNVEEFLRFISGMYSHENELRQKIPGLVLDAVVQEMYPCLWYDLKKAMRDAKEEADNAMAVDN
ncbi:hypothetical protein CFC21_044776 [Triticum aestivum]|nr:hypothetical protein CFC21_044776 [Triticum aestivum]